jgi:hypothetical protein
MLNTLLKALKSRLLNSMSRSFLGSECFYLYAFILFCSASKALWISIEVDLKVERLKIKH